MKLQAELRTELAVPRILRSCSAWVLVRGNNLVIAEVAIKMVASSAINERRNDMTTQLWSHQGPLTKAQFQRGAEALQAQVKARTVDRSEENVAATIRTLQALLALPECGDLYTSFYWFLGRNGEVIKRRVYDGDIQEETQESDNFTDHRVLRLRNGRFFISTMEPSDQKYSVRAWKRISEEECPTIVRRFQIFPEEVEEIRRLITAD